ALPISQTGLAGDNATPARVAHALARPDLAMIQIAANSCCIVAVDSNLNRIYVSRTADPNGSNTTVVDGSSFSVATTIAGIGGAHNVDLKTRNFWLPGLYSGSVSVFSGRSDSQIATVGLSNCPTDSWIDSTRRYAWIAAQCGHGSDPVWAVNADTYKRVSGKIRTGGVMGVTVVNPATGKFYVNNTSGNYEIAPGSFALSPTSFGVAYAADSRTNLIYASAQSNTLNIVDGTTDGVVTSVALSYSPSAIAVNQRLNHLYLAHGTNVIDVRDATSGGAIATIMLGSGSSVISLAPDNRRARIYAAIAVGSQTYLLRVRDKY